MRSPLPRPPRPLAGLLAVAGWLVTGGAARADWYKFVDADGVLHVADHPPPKEAHEQVELYRTGPGKAQVISGSSFPQCRVSRADVIPATDRAVERYSRYDDIIAYASRLYAIPEALIRAVIKVESDYDPRVVSCAGAKGLMQVMPDEEKSERIDNVFDPFQNILAGTRMLRTKANHWGGDLVRTIASYHAGVGAVTKYNGVPPYETTQQYVKWVLKQYERYKEKDLARGAVMASAPSMVTVSAPVRPIAQEPAPSRPAPPKPSALSTTSGVEPPTARENDEAAQAAGSEEPGG